MKLATLVCLEISRQIKLNLKRKCSTLPNNSDMFGSGEFAGQEKMLTLKNRRQE